ncbi:glycosyltransferase family A protein [Hymenobacter sp. BT770]|nr:glycosyltransferase family A protein [Hymenobacter sp. BT770]MDO3417258.1 glycosyltransferase family A protein [Hymenobacter sp. BT770]
MPPLISIITCFLNQEKFLEESIRSVLRQNYANWQLILINDGSTDSSTAMAREYAEQYPEKIHYHEHDGRKNKGASASRNIGISLAKGDFIAFLDGDDIWLPEYLQNQALLFQKNPDAEMVCEATLYWYSWKDQNTTDIITPVGGPQNILIPPYELILNLYPLGHGAAPCICAMVVRKKTLMQYGLFDESFRGMYDDQTLLIKIYLNASVYLSSSCFNVYRQRPDSLVHTSHNIGDYVSIRVRFLKWLYEYIQQQPILYPLVMKRVKTILFSYQYPRVHKVLNRVKRLVSKFPV